MNNMEAKCICFVIGHLQVKELIYTIKKCSLCNKRCLFRIRRMVKCNACNHVMHKKCFEVNNNRYVHTPSGGIEVDQRSNKDVTAITILNHSRLKVADTADTRRQNAGERGLDTVLKTELSWLWNKENSAVFRMKIELKIRQNYYVEYYRLEIKEKLWNDVLMDLMSNEEKNGRRHDSGSGDHVRN